MMGTSPESLRDLLARVHERLSQADSVEPESRQLLIALTGDIERALGRDAEPGARAAARHPVQRLEGLAVRFEADHPSLAQVLRQLIDALGKAGI
jgi:hypothetical protein